MKTMFDNLITRLTSPGARRRHTYHCSEVQSDPEDTDSAVTSRKPRVLERRRKGNKKLFETGLRQARSLGRLDGLKEVCIRGSVIRRSDSQAERLADYGRCLTASESHLNGRRGDLDRIQELFPNDALRLHEQEILPTYSMNAEQSRRREILDGPSTSSCRRRPSLSNRIFLMETPCGMSNLEDPVRTKPRHYFLFSDVLLIAKPKTTGTFKLKEVVSVSEIWLEPYPRSDTGFLIGYPGPARTYLVNFCTQAARNIWWTNLKQTSEDRLQLQPSVTTIKVIFKDSTTSTECSKLIKVFPETSITNIKRLFLDETQNDADFTLWCRERDSPPCPLLGWERLYSIQMARIKQSLSVEEGFDLAHCNNRGLFCHIKFELKPNYETMSKSNLPLKFFRKNSSRIFGAPLKRLVVNKTLHPVLITILKGLYQEGPNTQGIFRRCASIRALREFRERIDTEGAAVCEDLANSPPLLLGALLKDFLRSLPSPLLHGNIREWLNDSNLRNLEGIRRLINNFPRENYLLLSYVICVLYQINKRSEYNLMTTPNLGVCIGPSLLWDPSQTEPLVNLTALVELLIIHCQTLFGPQVISLLGESANDSGAEESDSLHSLGLSLDSVELSKDQKSLSRDSGLTLSEDDRDSPGLNYNYANNFHRSDWTRQPARVRALDNAWMEEDEAFCASNESLCMPPVPPRRPPPLRHLPPVHLPPIYRPPPPPPPTYATARLFLVTDSESESYV